MCGPQGPERLAGKMQYLDFGTIFFMVVAIVIIFQLRSVLQTGTAHGMCLLDSSLDALVKQGAITLDAARRAADNPGRFKEGANAAAG